MNEDKKIVEQWIYIQLYNSATNEDEYSWLRFVAEIEAGERSLTKLKDSDSRLNKRHNVVGSVKECMYAIGDLSDSMLFHRTRFLLPSFATVLKPKENQYACLEDWNKSGQKKTPSYITLD